MTTISDAMLETLADRGLDPELAVRLGFGSLQRDDLGGEALVIPFVRRGEIVRRKYRTFGANKRFSQDRGGVRCAWNEDALRDDSLVASPLVICEGELDAMAAMQAGFQRTISVPDGAPSPGDRSKADLDDATKYEWLREVMPLLSKERCPAGIILASDGDDNGAALLHDLAIQLGRARCKFITYPLAKRERGRPRLKDLNEVLEDYGEKGIVATLNGAQFFQITGVYRMSELPPDPPSIIYEIQFDALSDHYKVRLGDMAVWTGIPGMGKTTVVQDIVCRIVQHYGVNVCWASFEQRPQRDHKRAFRTWLLERRLKDQTAEDWEIADAWIDKHHTFIVPSMDDDVTIEWFLDRAEFAVVQRECRVVVVDPWNEMDHFRARHESETEYTGRAIKMLKKFANSFQVHLIVVAHPSKLEPGKDGKLPVPNLYNISGSAHWFNKVDLGMVVHREGDNTIVRNMKSRYHDIIGRPGQVTMQFCGDDRRFREHARG